MYVKRFQNLKQRNICDISSSHTTSTYPRNRNIYGPFFLRVGNGDCNTAVCTRKLLYVILYDSTTIITVNIVDTL
jgi:hypothetical protein